MTMAEETELTAEAEEELATMGANPDEKPEA